MDQREALSSRLIGPDVIGDADRAQYYASSPCCEIAAHKESLRIRYPPSKDFPGGEISNMVQLHISSIPGLQLGLDAFEGGEAVLPGLTIKVTGNVVEQGKRELSFGHAVHGFPYYRLRYSFQDSMRESGQIPELMVTWKKTRVPTSKLHLS